ncbi:unnamed protein product [Lepeophtheirus salmonis]|uniref:DnaJ homolog subfamily B member 9 n=1 Tax=Lepeophtheirus salmonis TaxID=72036 RepID=A0A7R8CGX6_LEPSM|nr:unnamed protein product [Lepeophtheirus salmonis]CAF2762265.1 unnamed protein product [Lepeophtheirus salmonis]
MKCNNPYKVLGVNSTDDRDTIKKSYQSLLLSSHPDKSGSSETEISNIVESWRVLSDPVLRSKLDSELEVESLCNQHACSNKVFQVKLCGFELTIHLDEIRG